MAEKSEGSQLRVNSSLFQKSFFWVFRNFEIRLTKDEPTSGLDSTSAFEIICCLQRAAKEYNVSFMLCPADSRCSLSPPFISPRRIHCSYLTRCFSFPAAKQCITVHRQIACVILSRLATLRPRCSHRPNSCLNFQTPISAALVVSSIELTCSVMLGTLALNKNSYSTN